MTATSEAVNFRQHGKQHGLAHAGAGKDAHTLAAQAVRNACQRTDTGVDRVADTIPEMLLAVVSRNRCSDPVRSGGPPSRGSPMALIT